MVSFHLWLLQAMEEQATIPQLTVADIAGHDADSGYSNRFDELYQKALRDVYLVQKHNLLACQPEYQNVLNKKSISKNFEHYFLELKQQRSQMACLYQEINRYQRWVQATLIDKYGQVNKFFFDSSSCQELQNIENKKHVLFSHSVKTESWPARRTNFYGTVPCEVQLKINRLDLFRAQKILYWCQNSPYFKEKCSIKQP